MKKEVRAVDVSDFLTYPQFLACCLLGALGLFQACQLVGWVYSEARESIVEDVERRAECRKRESNGFYFYRECR